MKYRKSGNCADPRKLLDRVIINWVLSAASGKDNRWAKADYSQLGFIHPFSDNAPNIIYEQVPIFRG